MKSNNLNSKESINLTYTYVSISVFLIMVVSMVTKNLDNCEKTIEFHPIVSVIVVLNMITLITLNFLKKNIFQKG
jgi:fumarate reductase subunit C